MRINAPKLVKAFSFYLKTKNESGEVMARPSMVQIRTTQVSQSRRLWRPKNKRSIYPADILLETTTWHRWLTYASLYLLLV